MPLSSARNIESEPGIQKELFWLASWPKSGNTWIRAMFSAYINGGVIDINKLNGSLGDKDGYSLLRVTPIELGQLTYIDRLSLRAAQTAHMQEISFFRPVVVKTHTICNNHFGYPTDVPHQCKGAVYVVRDPRDVAISYADHMGTDIDKAIAAMGDSGTSLYDKEHEQVMTMLGSWSEHVMSWLGDHPYPVTVIPYEEMIKDPVWALASFLDAIGWRKDMDKVAASAQACAFDRLKNQENENGFKERSNASEQFFRSGKSGQWRDILTPAQVRKIEMDHGAVMTKLGYELTTEQEAA